MRIAILTNEYPPHVYGGAGVHVEYLTRELARIEDSRHTVSVICFGDQVIRHGNLTVQGISPGFALPFQDPRHKKFQETMLRDLVMAGMLEDMDIVHCHTWYSHLAGCLARQLTGARLVLTTHSLEPHRPWKVEQLGTAYNASSWIERTAYENADGVIAVSAAMREDVHSLYGVSYDKIRIIHNGIDLDQYRPTSDPSVLAKYKIDPKKPYVLFVGRITRQKGIIHLVERHQEHQARSSGRALRGSAGHRRDRPRAGAEGRAGPPRVRRADHLDRSDRSQGGDHTALLPGVRLRLPVGLRAVRDHQPGGHGLRDTGGRVGGGGNQGSRDPGRDRITGSL